MPNLLLQNSDIFSNDDVLCKQLQNRFQILKDIRKAGTEVNSDITFEWNFYKDGKAWLCKAMLKKKTIFWISVWDDCFKVTFYFSGKKKEAFLESDINESYKGIIKSAKPAGKICPLTIEFKETQDIKDFATIVALKIKLK